MSNRGDVPAPHRPSQAGYEDAPAEEIVFDASSLSVVQDWLGAGGQPTAQPDADIGWDGGRQHDRRGLGAKPKTSAKQESDAPSALEKKLARKRRRQAENDATQELPQHGVAEGEADNEEGDSKTALFKGSKRGQHASRQLANASSGGGKAKGGRGGASEPGKTSRSAPELAEGSGSSPAGVGDASKQREPRQAKSREGASPPHHPHPNEEKAPAGDGDAATKPRKKKTRSRQKNIRKDRRPMDQRPRHLRPGDPEFCGRGLTEETRARLWLPDAIVGEEGNDVLVGRGGGTEGGGTRPSNGRASGTGVDDDTDADADAADTNMSPRGNDLPNGWGEPAGPGTCAWVMDTTPTPPPPPSHSRNRKGFGGGGGGGSSKKPSKPRKGKPKYKNLASKNARGRDRPRGASSGVGKAVARGKPSLHTSGKNAKQPAAKGPQSHGGPAVQEH